MMPDDPSVSEALDVLQQSASHETEQARTHRTAAVTADRVASDSAAIGGHSG